MASKRHITLKDFSSAEIFGPKGLARSPSVPRKDRAVHGNYLTTQYNAIVQAYQEKRVQVVQPITEDLGIYVEIVSFPEIKLPLDSLDTRDFNLYSCKATDDEREVAIVFIPEARRRSFQYKIEQYLDPKNDSIKGLPRNHRLIASIADIRLANLRSFWTDDHDKFPEDNQQVIWWELWLKRRGNEETLDIAQSLANRIDAKLGNTSQYFFDSAVILIQASASQLEQALELISNLEELRCAKETPDTFIHSSPMEQQQWAEDLAGRTKLQEGISTSICILDAGVNYHHPILSLGSHQANAESWDPNWPHYDTYNPPAPFNDHGSRQAGLALFGDVQYAVLSAEPVSINHCIESARILPPRGNNDPELYGAITVGTAAKLEAERPDWHRVYSLAITSPAEAVGGQPSSWSSEIDLSASGFMDGLQRLYVISAGNNRELSAQPEYWDQIHLAQIEDPAQSWNALTVGAYTEFTTNDNPDFNGWSPIAEAGDAAPATRSSVNWGWRKQAPFKPDIVAEGGNRLISPDQTEITNADTVSLLTTSGRATGQLFETTMDTSAATAIASHQAAILMAEYPEYWPETIRGLMVHSADWTPRMLERFGLLHAQHSPKVAKEVMLRTVGYGVTNIDRARYSAEHALTLIAQDKIQPFTKNADAKTSDDPKMNEMQLYQLPWPVEALQQLPPELEVKLRITLSYYIEPNPGRRGYRQRYSYQSHGLRFEVIRPGQPMDNFRSFVNGLADSKDYEGPEGDGDGWLLGPQLRTRGSLHSDIWTGSAADLADMHTIAVFPVGGWWKYRRAQERWQNSVRYSLLVSIEVPDEEVNIYSEIQTQIEATVVIEV